MRYGVCIGARGSEYVKVIKNSGYDYIEGRFESVKEMDESTFNGFINELRDNDIKIEAFNCFFPKGTDIQLVGEGAEFESLKEYSKIGFEKCAILGGEILVVGSGKSRNIPEGFSKDRAKEQYASFLNFCGDLALEYNMQIVIEPLNSGETNFINTVQDGIDMCKFTTNKNVFVLADFFHVYKSGETLDAIENAGDLLRHVHIARANAGRGQPTEVDKDTLIMWSKALKKCGYDGRISIESRYIPDFETAIVLSRPALNYFN